MMMPIAGTVSSRIQPRYLIMGGMAVVALALWHMTALAPDADFGFFVWARVFQMIGLPFLFVPISAAAYIGLKPWETNQASSLINVSRNLGGSIGVSLSNMILLNEAQVHQAMLVANAIPSSAAYQHTLEAATRHFQSAGAPLAEAQKAALGWLGQVIGKQAVLLAYIDVFQMVAIVAFLMIPVALLLRSGPAPAGADH
jgi:DHA2 family multidrug resistance protein